MISNFQNVEWLLQSSNRLHRPCVKREVAQGSISLPSLSPGRGRLKQADLESTHAHHRLSLLAHCMPQRANSDSLSSPSLPPKLALAHSSLTATNFLPPSLPPLWALISNARLPFVPLRFDTEVIGGQELVAS